jgi:hypothetical protein
MHVAQAPRTDRARPAEPGGAIDEAWFGVARIMIGPH